MGANALPLTVIHRLYQLEQVLIFWTPIFCKIMTLIQVVFRYKVKFIGNNISNITTVFKPVIVIFKSLTHAKFFFSKRMLRID